MGYQVSDQAGSQEHTNQTAYVGNDVFGPLLKQLANQYGTQQASADLIFGGKQYGKARTFMPDRYRDLSASEAQSVLAANNTEQAKKKMPTYSDSSGHIWKWDNESNIYVGYGPDKDGRFTEVMGAWSPYDVDRPTPPWKRGGSGGDETGSGSGTSVGGGGSTTTPPSGGGGGGGGGGSTATPPTTPGGSGGTGGGSAGNGGIGGDTGSGRGDHVGGGGLNPATSVNPQTGRPWGVSRRVPGVGRADEQGLTGLGVRTESPTTGSDSDFHGDAWVEPGSGEVATGQRGRTVASGRRPVYDQAPELVNPPGKGTASEGGDWLNMKRKPEGSAEQDTFAQLLAGLGRR